VIRGPGIDIALELLITDFKENNRGNNTEAVKNHIIEHCSRFTPTGTYKSFPALHNAVVLNITHSDKALAIEPPQDFNGKLCHLVVAQDSKTAVLYSPVDGCLTSFQITFGKPLLYRTIDNEAQELDAALLPFLSGKL